MSGIGHDEIMAKRWMKDGCVSYVYMYVWWGEVKEIKTSPCTMEENIYMGMPVS